MQTKIFQKRSKYIFHPERQNEITYLITLNSDPDDVLFFLHFDKLNMQEFKENSFLVTPMQKNSTATGTIL